MNFGHNRSMKNDPILSIVNYQLSIINYQLSIINYQLSIINYSIWITYEIKKKKIQNYKIEKIQGLEHPVENDDHPYFYYNMCFYAGNLLFFAPD